MGIETEGAGIVEGKIPYTYKEDIEQKRLWLERKIKRELKIVINAIIDKVIWKGCNLDVLILAFPELTRAIVYTNLRYQTEFPKRETQELESNIKMYAKKKYADAMKLAREGKRYEINGKYLPPAASLFAHQSRATDDEERSR